MRNLQFLLKISKPFSVTFPSGAVFLLNELVNVDLFSLVANFASIVWWIRLSKLVLGAVFKWHPKREYGSAQRCFNCFLKIMINGQRNVEISVIPFLARGDIWHQNHQIFEGLKTQSRIHVHWLTSGWSNRVSIGSCIHYRYTNMCTKPGSNLLNTVVLRASYILPILRQFSWQKSSKTRGGDLPPPWKIQNQNQCIFLSFGVDPLYWLSFIEIGEMACSRPAWCTHEHALEVLPALFVGGF